MKVKKTPFRKDTLQTKSLEAAGKTAAANAVRHAKALDLTITYIDNGNVIEEQPDGALRIIGKIELRETPIVLTKGMVLHVK